LRHQPLANQRNYEHDQRHQLLGQLNWRYATKQFDPNRKINTPDWATLEEALLARKAGAGLIPNGL
jgi:hypothetical protein